MNTTETTDITCNCDVHQGAITIRVPSAMLANPKPGAKTSARYIKTATHNLIDMQKLFRTYEQV